MSYIGVPVEVNNRQEGAISSVALGLLAAVWCGTLLVLVISLLNPRFPAFPVLVMAAVSAAICLLTYGLLQRGQVRTAGYFFIIAQALHSAALTFLFGGSAGPLAISFIFPILASVVMIGARAPFLTATLSAFLLLAFFGVELRGLAPQVIPGELAKTLAGSGPASPLIYAGLIIRVGFFYVAAFLGWFASRALNRALIDAYRYLAGLEAANRKLRASEEEVRAANEGLMAAQEQLVRTEKLAACRQMAGGVAWELRDPLRAIKQAVDYTRGKLQGNAPGMSDPLIRDYLDIMDDEVESVRQVNRRFANPFLGGQTVGGGGEPGANYG